jgi:N-acylneuraminate cytidylyltransferase
MRRRCLALIPARGGSTRLRNKAIIEFCGKPMIGHVLDAALGASVFEDVHVSTDSERIRSVVEGLGLRVAFLRDPSLADDRTPLMPVMQWVLRMYEQRGFRFDDVCLLLPTAPLLEASDIRAAHAAYSAADPPRPLLGVAAYPAPVEWAFERKADGTLTPVQPGMFAVRSQDLTKKYYDTGTIAIFPVAQVLSDSPPDDRSFVSFVLPREKAVDIDDAEDLELARVLFRGRSGAPPSEHG